MTREEAKELLPIMQAFIEGKTIECRTKTWELNKGWRYSTNWEKTEQLIFRDNFEYRIKPEPKCRPFKDKEECWQEMQKHQPFGWVIGKINKNFYNIDFVYSCNPDNGYGVRLSYYGEASTKYENMFKGFTFADGEPFGIKEE